MKILSITFLLLLSTSVLAEKKPAPVLIKIYVYAAGAKDSGFVDSARSADTVKDIQSTLSKRGGVGIVSSEKDADISLEVLGSGQAVVGTESSTSVRPGIFGGVQATTTTQQTAVPSIAARLHIRGSEYTKDFSATANVLWRLLAKSIGDQAVSWINTNWSTLQKTLRDDKSK